SCARVDLDPGDEARDVREHARKHRYAAAPQAVSHAMKEDSVEARVGEHHFEPIPSGRIALEHGTIVGAQRLEHLRRPARAARWPAPRWRPPGPTSRRIPGMSP